MRPETRAAPHPRTCSSSPFAAALRRNPKNRKALQKVFADPKAKLIGFVAKVRFICLRRKRNILTNVACHGLFQAGVICRDGHWLGETS